MTNVQLDNRIFAMQSLQGKCPEVSELVFKADVAYLQDRDSEALELIIQAEMLQHDNEDLERMNLEIQQEYADAIIGQCVMCGDILFKGVAIKTDTCNSCLSEISGL